jgi:hypothetical protein
LQKFYDAILFGVQEHLQENMDNREKMKELCATAGSYPAAAALIAEATKRPLSVDAIKSWTCAPTTKRARPCPDWAIEALQNKLKTANK